jgi:hypothetical protein
MGVRTTMALNQEIQNARRGWCANAPAVRTYTLEQIAANAERLSNQKDSDGNVISKLTHADGSRMYSADQSSANNERWQMKEKAKCAAGDDSWKSAVHPCHSSNAAI